MTTLFISDLHLDLSRPKVIDAFKQFLTEEASSADALYILGDFFEAWIGDDDRSDLNTDISNALKQLVDSGTPVYLMHGNRDFLIGEDFCQQSGCQLITDPVVVNLYGQKTLLMHGDSLCTDDVSYMEFRMQCRSQAWQSAVLAKPLEERRLLAQQLRANSREAMSNKAEDIMDVNQQAVADILKQYDTDLLIHGHTHRPDIHSLSIEDKTATRIVLGDWESYGWVLRYQPDNNYSLDKFAIE